MPKITPTQLMCMAFPKSHMPYCSRHGYIGTAASSAADLNVGSPKHAASSTGARKRLACGCHSLEFLRKHGKAPFVAKHGLTFGFWDKS